MSSTFPLILPPLSKPEAFDLFAQHVSPAKATFFQSAGIDFIMGRREGPFIRDPDGATRLVNCHCNGGVYNLDHRHPALVQTLVASLQTLDIGNHHLRLRRLDRTLHRWTGRQYPYVLPGPISQ